MPLHPFDESPGISLFTRLRDHLSERFEVFDCTKATLVHVSHTIEDLILREHMPAMLLTGFQESGHWRAETERYRALAEVAQQVYIFAGGLPGPDSHEREIRVTLGGDAPLRQEWFVCALTPHFSFVLCGQDRHTLAMDAVPDADRVAAAQARVAAAEATLNRLRGPARATQLEVAESGVAQAQAALGQVVAPARAVNLAAAQVEVTSARVALTQAELDLEQATLTAPFDGTVARVDLTIGELAGPTVPAIVVADFSAWKVETEDLTELEVVRLREGAAVAVRFDALPDLELGGTVRQIKLIGGNRQGDIIYTVVVQLDQGDPRLHWNMTAVVSTNA